MATTLGVSLLSCSEARSPEVTSSPLSALNLGAYYSGSALTAGRLLASPRVRQLGASND